MPSNTDPHVRCSWVLELAFAAVAANLGKIRSLRLTLIIETTQRISMSVITGSKGIRLARQSAEMVLNHDTV